MGGGGGDDDVDVDVDVDVCVCVCVCGYVRAYTQRYSGDCIVGGYGGWGMVGQGDEVKCGCRDARVDVASTRGGDVHACDF